MTHDAPKKDLIFGWSTRRLSSEKRNDLNFPILRTEAADPEGQVVTKPRTEIKTPKMFQVVLLNDYYTPMDFVVHILQKFFRKDVQEASRIMLDVHRRGAGVAGVYTFEVAETKVFLVNEYAKRHQYPLKATLNEAAS